MISVDALDLRILAALQDDGRLTNQQLADVVGLSAETVAAGASCGNGPMAQQSP